MEKQENQQEQLFIPREILEAANIPSDYDVTVTCYDGIIIITEAEMDDGIPMQVYRLVEEFVISRSQTRAALITNGCIKKLSKGGNDDECRNY